VGAVFSAMPLGIGIGTVLGGSLADRMPPPPVLGQPGGAGRRVRGAERADVRRRLRARRRGRKAPAALDAGAPWRLAPDCQAIRAGRAGPPALAASVWHNPLTMLPRSALRAALRRANVMVGPGTRQDEMTTSAGAGRGSDHGFDDLAISQRS